MKQLRAFQSTHGILINPLAFCGCLITKKTNLRIVVYILSLQDYLNRFIDTFITLT